MKKSTQRRIRKGVKSMRKNLRQAAAPFGGVEAVLALGAVAAGAALHPEVRARTKDLALAALDRLEGLIAGAQRATARVERTLESH